MTECPLARFLADTTGGPGWHVGSLAVCFWRSPASAGPELVLPGWARDFVEEVDGLPRRSVLPAQALACLDAVEGGVPPREARVGDGGAASAGPASLPGEEVG
jgi:hypothetical protein